MCLQGSTKTGKLLEDDIKLVLYCSQLSIGCVNWVSLGRSCSRSSTGVSSKLRGGKACCVAGTGAGGTLIVVFVSSLWLQDGQVLSFRVFESVN